MAFTYVPITGSYPGQTGTITVTPVTAMVNQGQTVSASQTFSITNGAVSFYLAATDSPGNDVRGTYLFGIQVTGQEPLSFTTTIPSVQALTGININTQLPWGYTPPTPSRPPRT